MANGKSFGFGRLIETSNERAHRFTQDLRNYFSRAAGGNCIDRHCRCARFSATVECDYRFDDRGSESDAGRALFYARALQLAIDLGCLYLGAVLAGNSFCTDAERLLDQKLALE